MKGEFGKETWPQFFDEPVPAVCNRRTHRPGALSPDGAVGRTGLSKTLAIYWRFLLAGLMHRTQTGSVVPSQRFLINQMLAPVPPTYSGQMIELGAGTGALTQRLAA